LPAALTAVVTLVAAAVVPLTVRATDTTAAAADGLRVVAYNIRMGFGLDGRFDLDGLAGTIARQRSDVVLLSEVDRAWLLNGGHDTLALLARQLDLPYRFAPAADAVWGDAVLTRLPVVEARTARLSAVGAPTGAQALGVVVRSAGRDVAFVSTHLQPPPDGGPVAQAGEVAAFARAFADGRPLVVGGDMDTQPGDPAFQALLGAGVEDGLAAARPLHTSPADAPDEQIDHLLVSPRHRRLRHRRPGRYCVRPPRRGRDPDLHLIRPHFPGKWAFARLGSPTFLESGGGVSLRRPRRRRRSGRPPRRAPR
jgi:endonuclease/exonuclease/phosphatase family metal-dependent hydrolase